MLIKKYRLEDGLSTGKGGPAKATQGNELFASTKAKDRSSNGTYWPALLKHLLKSFSQLATYNTAIERLSTSTHVVAFKASCTLTPRCSRIGKRSTVRAWKKVARKKFRSWFGLRI